MDICTILLFILTAQSVTQPPSVGLKITERASFGGRSRQNTSYIESDRRRREFRSSSGNVDGPPLAFISRCDLDQSTELNLESRQYASRALPKWPIAAELRERIQKSRAPSDARKPTILLEIETVDTGERGRTFLATKRVAWSPPESRPASTATRIR
jgi:hypothetical protein